MNKIVKRPNLLFIMADQFRTEWLGCIGKIPVFTPNLDAIVKQGVRFSRAISNGPICAPSRISMTSGLYPNRMGAYDNTAWYPPNQPTFYKALRDAGYRVGGVGKADLKKSSATFSGDSKSGFPLMEQLGFTDSWITTGKLSVSAYTRYFLTDQALADEYAEDYKVRKAEQPQWYSKVATVSSDIYQDGYIGRKAVKLIEQFTDECQDQPWHLFVSFVGPHPPWDAPQEYFDMYRNTQFPPSIKCMMEGKPVPVQRESERNFRDLTDNDINQVKQHYAGMITLIDYWIGKMRETLEQKGISDNTITIFTSDHGEMLGDYGVFSKNKMYEGALRVPLIISIPGITAGNESKALVELVDLYPTLLDMAGIDYVGDPLDGKSLMSILKGETNSHKNYLFSELNPIEHWPYAAKRMVCDNRYKLIIWDKFKELYDLEKDPFEMNNIANIEPDIAKKLEAIMDEFSKDAKPPQQNKIKKEEN